MCSGWSSTFATTALMAAYATPQVYVMDSTVFPFFRAEQYHQFHSNFFHNPDQPKSDDNGHYPDSYVKDLYQLQISLGRIADTG